MDVERQTTGYRLGSAASRGKGMDAAQHRRCAAYALSLGFRPSGRYVFENWGPCSKFGRKRQALVLGTAVLRFA